MEQLIRKALSSSNLDLTLKKLDYSDSYCYEHIPKRFNKCEGIEWDNAREKYKINMIKHNESLICPRCQLDKDDEILARETSKAAYVNQMQMNATILTKQSIVTDKTLLQTSFQNYINTGEEEERNKKHALQLAEEILNGSSINVWLQSNLTGVGKSHLAMSMLKHINGIDRSAVFIEIEQMLRLIKDSFNNKDSKYTEQYIMDLVSKVDVLVLDDLGAETGDINTNKNATEYTSKILKGIMNARQGKSTIITTNLSTMQLKEIYDPKVVSRLMTDVKAIKFENAIDKRPIRHKLMEANNNE